MQDVAAAAPFRYMITSGGFRMSVAMANCGAAGWVTDRNGYRYDRLDPVSGEPWPSIPACFALLASEAAVHAGFKGFVSPACLINRYEAGASLSLHQDRNERDCDAPPIVSVSLGIPAVFLFGGLKRADGLRRIPLRYGDVVVWSGPARMRYHGITRLKEDYHSAFSRQRINLTFRKTT